MSRPAVSVVMPFAGERGAAHAAVQALLELGASPGDELILADNSDLALKTPGVTVVRADRERSPAHARNVGAEHAQHDWILFLDADCRAARGLLDAYFAEPVDSEIGALAGEIVPAPEARTLAARYGAARSFLSQRAHLAHPYRPRAVAANLLVRRSAFEQLGGFYEGVRAAEDTDFSWRLQAAGWRLELRPDAVVEHRYRTTVSELRRQWRGYSAGRAWLGRRYVGFTPQPALARVLRRAGRRSGQREATEQQTGGRRPGRLEHASRLALDGLLATEELAGFGLSNRPARSPASGPVEVVLVADRFPAPGDPLVEYARALQRVRVEAVARPHAVALRVARELQIDYREDDGILARMVALAKLFIRHPVGCLVDLSRRHQQQPSLSALAPAAIRLQRNRTARLQALGADGAQTTAARLAALTGRRLDR